MSITLDEIRGSLSPESRARVQSRTRELLREEMTLQALRKELEITQEYVAERMSIRQANVSKVENRSDMLISTLRNYLEAMGGKLDLVARMPGRPPVTLEGFTEKSSTVE
ncbi:helix-turn-helix domain-containing protein [Pseudomonas sp. Irchel 3E13]|jgi:DNA-binding transcriptional regulator YiaG|uniref:helix-turn-helix domain-containing protein n=1 Tax=Pseudomonas sp. Irchel 3E13 TaxID=2008975 RepID=UPI000BA44EC4|nr:XRE family transcriptional regulator [Pseudomonas sp. Irchel 3E13]